MTLPLSGMMTAAMINAELGRAHNAPFSLNDPAIRALAEKPSGKIMFSDFYGKANELVVKVTSATQYNTLIKSFFTPDDWASDKAKRLIISGVDFGNMSGAAALAVTDAASGQAGSFGGKLTLEIEAGAFISGSGGKWSVASAGNGGIALHANFKGKNGNNLQLINKGIIRGGGGSGGQGGKGGGGAYAQNVTVREPTEGDLRGNGYGWTWVNNFSRVIISWGGQELLRWDNQSFSTTFYDINGARYYRGTPDGGVSGTSFFKIYRTFEQIQNVYTDGGTGGAGGTGQGFNLASGAGASGNAGGTNAGRGGNGGHGGAWGSSGANGDAGINGNNGNGLVGSLSGLGGAAIGGITNVDIIDNSGLIIGRQE